MRAAYIMSLGPPEVIQVGDLADPRPGPGEVLVRAGASAVNPIDLYIRAGTVSMPLAFPYIIGCDLAGTVEAIGPGVTRFKPGDRVWGSNQGLLGRQGASSELAAVAEEWLYATPARLTDVEASSLALVGITAHLGLFSRARLQAGETVFVTGGTGGVGSMVIQMARAAGARVATTAGTPEKAELCRTMGAEVVFNHRGDDIPAMLRERFESGVDVWFETQRQPDLETSIPLLKRRGRMILMAGRTARPVLPLGSFYPRDCSLLGFAMFNASPEEQRRCAEDIISWVDQGKLSARVGHIFPLSEAREAHRFLEESTLGGAGKVTGKVVISIA
jgi:NADPH2:quinone reductase